MSAATTTSSSSTDRSSEQFVRTQQQPHDSSSTHSRSPSTLTLLTTTSSAANDTAPHHRIFDGKHLDPQLLLFMLHEWMLHEWIGDERRRYFQEARIADRAAISLSLVDTRFFTSLYHHYHVRQQLGITEVRNTWKRRIDAVTAAVPPPAAVTPASHEQQSPLITWFIPRFDVVYGNADAWSTASTDEYPTWLLDRINNRQLILLEADTTIVRTPLPVVTSIHAVKPSLPSLAASLEQVPRLTSLRLLDCWYWQADVVEHRLVCASLRHVPQLTTLELSDDGAGSDRCRSLADALEHVPQLNSLHLRYTKIDADGCRALVQSLYHTPHLTVLDLHKNPIGAGGLCALAAALRHVPDLTTLNLEDCSIADDDEGEDEGEGDCWARFAESLRHVTQLTNLWIDENDMSTNSARALADALVRLPHLTHLGHNKVGRGDGAATLQSVDTTSIVARIFVFTCLPFVPRLSALELTNIDTGTLRELAASLHHAPHLTSLQLPRCHMQATANNDDAWQALASSLQHVPELTELLIDVNDKMTITSARALADALFRLPHLTLLDGRQLPHRHDLASLQSLHAKSSFVERIFVCCCLLPLTPRLTSLELTKVEIDTVRELTARLHHVPHLTTLRLRGSGAQIAASDDAWQAFANALQHVPELTELDLRNNAIEAPLAVCVVDAIREHLPHIVVVNGVYALRMVRNGVRSLKIELELELDDIAICFATLLLARERRTRTAVHDPLITSFELTGCRLRGMSCIEAIGTILSLLPHLTSLFLDGSPLGDACSSEIFALLRHIQQQASLSAERSSDDDSDDQPQSSRAHAIVHVPVSNLTRVNVEYNAIGDEGCRAFAEMLLPRAPRLTSLDLSGNRVRGDGCAALAAALVNVPQLTSLVLSWNQIGGEGCRALAASLRHVPRLTELNMCDASIGVDGARALASSLRRVPLLTALNVSTNYMTDDGCHALAWALCRTPHLRSLDVSYNAIRGRGCLALAFALPFVRRLMCLDVSRNHIDDRALKALAFARRVFARQLMLLDVGENYAW